MRHLRTIFAVLGAVTVLALAGNTIALAATGDSFILGKANKATTLTTLNRTHTGPALKVQTKRASNPPFTVNGTGRVAHLNADRVDGLDGAMLQNRVIRYTFPTSAGSSNYTWDLPALPSGTYMATYAIYASTTSANFGQCWFLTPDDGSLYKVVGNASLYQTNLMTWGATGVLNRGFHWQLHCIANGGSFSVDPEASEITFTRIDSVRPLSASTARTTGDRHAGR